ncbi:MAG TPA: fumarylacetoacetate hydrolase family protein [Chloroflexota bacterium]|jgi:2-keto-4-pentenoate hydratase/2-oxohepta-3-ene-1,7-dioic acid hydratase in catechol pathway|nr:fumarylacetoacetate hydrolase family protein [Chloroflexota bacterium]
MRLVTYRAGVTPRIGAVRDDRVVDLSTLAPDMLSLIDQGADGLARARDLASSAREEMTLPLDTITLLAPIPRPRKNIVCLGMNYAAHAIESARARGNPEVLPKYPVFFTKAVTCVNDPDGVVPLHQEVTQQLDWEVELAFVIGRLARRVPASQAYDYVFGYTIINDVSARDLQTRHQQFFRAKSLDGCGPLGPWIVTADEIPDPHALGIRLRVNGRTMQDSVTGDLIFKIPELIETLSDGITVEPGDIVATGTPAGVGMGMNPQVWLQDGDVMEAEIDGIGVLRNTVGKG